MIDVPRNVEAERAVLSSVLLNPESFGQLLDRLEPDDFFDTSNRSVFGAMVTVHSKGLEADVVAVGDELARTGGAEKTDREWLAYLSELAGSPGSFLNVRSYIDIVEDSAVRRSLVSKISDAAQRAVTVATADDAVDMAERAVRETRHSRISYKTIREVLDAAIDGAGRRMSRGVSTGLNGLDAYLGGLQPEDLVLVAGRTSVGKTAFLLQLVRHAAGAGIVTGLFSLEMSEAQIAERLLSREARIESRWFRDRNVEADQEATVARAIGRIGDLPLYVAGPREPTLAAIRAQARLLRFRHQVGLIVVDYLQLVRVPGARSRYEEVGAVSWGLKELAREIGVPVLAAAQLNRSVENENRARRLSDLRESGNQEQDADVVILLHAKQDEPGAIICRVAKHRNGPTGGVTLKFKPEFGIFREAK